MINLNYLSFTENSKNHFVNDIFLCFKIPKMNSFHVCRCIFFKALYSFLTLLTIHSANLNKIKLKTIVLYIFSNLNVDDIKPVWKVFNHKHTGVFGNVLQQQWVFGQSLHFYWNDVFELQPAALGLTLCLLKETQHTSVFERHLLKHFLFFPFWFHVHAGTSMKELKRGSFFCLYFIWSKAHDWWLQNRAVSFWNHSPSVPSNLQFSKGRKKEITVVQNMSQLTDRRHPWSMLPSWAC